MTDPPPLLLLLGPPGHGVTAYAADVAAAVVARDPGAEVAWARDAEDAVLLVDGRERVHVHVTDRLLGASPEEAATYVERLASATRLSITAHDLPQESDGRMRERRTAAYARMLAAADATAVNSAHEVALVAENLPSDPGVRMIPLGARVPIVPARSDAGGEREPGASRDLVVMIAGYIYPGKGHAAACRAVSEAARELTSSGGRIGDVVVRAIGAPSTGHERDADALRADAAQRGVRFEVTGFLDDEAFAAEMLRPGIPLAAHEHVSASRSMLDWVELGRRPLVVESRYAAEMAVLRPDTMTRYGPDTLSERIAAAWRSPDTTWLHPGTDLSPSLPDVAAQYLDWWRR